MNTIIQGPPPDVSRASLRPSVIPVRATALWRRVWSNGEKTPTGEYWSSEGITCPSANLSTTNLTWTGLGPKVTAVASARPSYRVATSLHAWECVFPMSWHRQQFQKVTRYGHIFSLQVSITVLIWTLLRHGLFHSCPSYPAILQRTVHQHIVLSQLDNTLPIERTWDGHGVASKSRTLRHVTIRFGHCEREIFPTPPTNSCRHKNSYQNIRRSP